MDYIELTVKNPDQETRDLLTARLSDAGFESFVEAGGNLLAYIPGEDFRKEEITRLLDGILKDSPLDFSFNSIRERNWNLKWEKDYTPVKIGMKLFVRAPFHKKDSGYRHEIIIEPQMSFGTAHHETTRLMLEMMGDMDFRDKHVLDMGCGTGVLAIYSNKLGASNVIAIDNDEWAYNNTLHNIELNDLRHIFVIMGDSTSLTDESFDVVLANINRNILLDDISAYDKHLNAGGTALLSGFYEEDLEKIRQAAGKAGWDLSEKNTLNNWVAARFTKE